MSGLRLRHYPDKLLRGIVTFDSLRNAPKASKPTSHRSFPALAAGRSLGLRPVCDRAVWSMRRSTRDSFESDTGLDPLIGAHRELLRLYELLQFYVTRRPCIRRDLRRELEDSPSRPLPKFQSEFAQVRL